MAEPLEILKYKIAERPDLATKSNNIRREVFVVEQNVDPDIEYEFEEEANHYLLLANGMPVATARWRETDKGIKLERFATLISERNKGHGSLLLKTILDDTLTLDEPIYLHSQSHAIPFYLKHGFVVKGEPFHEAEIEHFMMEYVGKNADPS